LFFTSGGAGDGGKGPERMSDGGGQGGDGDKARSGQDGVVHCNEVDVAYVQRRITTEDLVEALGPDKRFAVVYVCGVPSMTDKFVASLTEPSPKGIGMEKHRVLCEKWW